MRLAVDMGLCVQVSGGSSFPFDRCARHVSLVSEKETRSKESANASVLDITACNAWSRSVAIMQQAMRQAVPQIRTGFLEKHILDVRSDGVAEHGNQFRAHL